MESLKINSRQVTLVDQVEDKLLNFLQQNNLKVGDSLPKELELAAALGVARNVVREALSRLKMMGMIETRTRRGMVITEPPILGNMKKVADPRIMSEQSLYEILNLRIALEIGICSDIFHYITRSDIEELESIVRISNLAGNNAYSMNDEIAFHSKLYQIAGNEIITEFQEIIRPVMQFVAKQFEKDFLPINRDLEKTGKLISHEDLLGYLKNNDETGFRIAIEQHFIVYKTFLWSKKIN